MLKKYGYLLKYTVYIAWIQAVVATFASLYASEFVGLVPCILCWYQRIFMYPLVIIIAIGIIKKDRNLPIYVLPLSIIGLAIAFYHFLLQMGVIPESQAPCVAGVSCASRYVEWFGFVTIPFLSLLAFAVITVSMLMYQYYLKNNVKRS